MNYIVYTPKGDIHIEADRWYRDFNTIYGFSEDFE